MHCCDRNKSYREELIEENMLANIRPALADYIAEYEVDGECPQTKDPAAEANRIRAKLKKLYELFLDDLIDKDMYKKEYEQLQAQLQEANAAAAVPHKDVNALKEFLSQEWEDVYKTFSYEEKAAFWKSFVQSITLHEDGKMDIVFL